MELQYKVFLVGHHFVCARFAFLAPSFLLTIVSGDGNKIIFNFVDKVTVQNYLHLPDGRLYFRSSSFHLER